MKGYVSIGNALWETHNHSRVRNAGRNLPRREAVEVTVALRSFRSAQVAVTGCMYMMGTST